MTSRFNPFDNMTFSYDRCFLCGIKLNESNGSEEHIYPKWLLREFDLYNESMYLLNRTRIKYKDLKIPCCKKCNSKMSKILEKPIKEAVQSGFDAFNNVDRDIVFVWLNKIAYGTLFKELSLKIDRKKPNGSNIFTKEMLQEKKMQYAFLQTILSNGVFVDRKPYSMIIVKINPGEMEKYWAYNNIINDSFFIRMNDIGIVANLQDNGLNEAILDESGYISKLNGQTLHPIQFAELCGRFFYKSTLFNRAPYYTMVFNDDKEIEEIISHDIYGDSYDTWDQSDYAKYLSFFWEPWKMKYEDIYKGNDQVVSYLWNEDGTFKHFE